VNAAVLAAVNVVSPAAGWWISLAGRSNLCRRRTRSRTPC
jgi:hypothetical protein